MLKNLFGFNPKENNLRTEILAGITTFLTMAYILALAPDMLGAAGMDKNAVFTATVVAAIIGTLLMAVVAKLPFALAPGVGITSFFAYTVCIAMGYPWQFALTAVLIEGLIFIILTVTNLREAILNAIPQNLKHAISAGIGLFIAFIGLQNAGIIVNNDATLVSLGDITHGSGLLAMIGLVITSLLLIFKVRGALLIGILGTSIIGIFMGITKFNGVISLPPSLEPTFFKFEFSQIFTKDMLIVIFTLLFVDMFDTIGTLVGVSAKAGMLEDGKIPKVKKAFLADAIATTTGAIFGTSTVTTYVESAAGVSEGGRTGVTSFTTVICFALSLFFAPIFLGIPSAATAPILVLVGVMMMESVSSIDLKDYSEAIPAVLCIVFMPLTYSISDGIVLGMISYVLLNLISGKREKLTISMYILAILFVFKFFI